jgi:phosphoribosylformylglycinamidine synthase subunit PurL
MSDREMPQPFPGDPPISPALYKKHKLTAEEQATVLRILGREPTYAELGVFSVMWSEHCSYKSSRVHLGRLPTTGPRVVQGPGENAGVVDIGDGFVAVFKMESHNHPSYIEPYQGAATGVGGILRDVFTMGARPIALLDSLRFGRPDHPRTPHLVRGVVAGIGGYGNCIGVPTVGGEVAFDKRYDGNILVNAFACGVGRKDRIFYGKAEGVGNPVIYVGARTGRDGIHGATMASDEFSAGGPSQRPTVQVGDPFMEKLLVEACLEIFAADVLAGIQDMGAAGLTSSSLEMADRAHGGLELNLDLVPRRARRLTPYEMLLSESQERMLLVAKKGMEREVLAICEKWDLDAAVIGRVTDTGRWVILATPGFDPLDEEGVTTMPVVVCDLPVAELTAAAPKYDRPRGPDPSLPARHAFDPASIAPPADLGEALLALLRSPNIGSRRWVYRQYDSIVRGGTAVRPGSDAGVVRVPCERDGQTWEKFLAFAADGNGRHVDLDPYVGGAMVIAEVCRNLVVTGAVPVGITDCLNFGSPENPVVMEQFARAIDGMAAACRALEVPVVSGNVSLYNDTDGRPILPSPICAAVGLIEAPEHLVRMRFSHAGDAVLLLGHQTPTGLGGSEYVSLATGETQGPPPVIDLDAEARLQKLCLALARQGLARAMHDVSDGGLAVALAECVVPGDEPGEVVGAALTLPVPNGTTPSQIVAHLFGEAPSRVIAAVTTGNLAQAERLAAELGVPVARLGQTGGDRLALGLPGGAPVLSVPTAALADARNGCLEGIVGALACPAPWLDCCWRPEPTLAAVPSGIGKLLGDGRACAPPSTSLPFRRLTARRAPLRGASTQFPAATG